MSGGEGMMGGTGDDAAGDQRGGRVRVLSGACGGVGRGLTESVVDRLAVLLVLSRQTGEVLQQAHLHDDKINGLSWDKHKITFVTYSVDTFAKLVDAKTLGATTPSAAIRCLFLDRREGVS